MTKQKKLSRRDLIVAGAATGAGIAAGGQSVAAVQTQAQAPAVATEELVLVNGRIHTFNANNAVVNTVTIRNGRFTAVGGAAPRAAAGRRIIDLRGRTAVPGIIDNHNHIVLMGNRPGYHTPLESAGSMGDVQETLAARAKEIPAGAWITTLGGFHRNQLVTPGEMPRLPTLAELDAAVSSHPVYLSEGFNGPSVTNSAGKKIFEGQNPPIPVGADGSIAPNAMATGRATLFLRQTLLTPDERRRGALEAVRYGLSLGVTTHLDQGAFQAAGQPSDGAAHEDNYSMYQPFIALHGERRLTARVRFNFLHQDATPELVTLNERLRNTYPFFGDDMLRTGGIGEFIGGFGPNSPMIAAAKLIAKARWRAEVHSLSQTDFQQEIQAFEAAHAETPINDLRWVVAHVPFITEPWVNRLKAVGGGLSLTSWRYLAGTPEQNGPDFRMIVANGIHCGMSSDGMQIAPMNPWVHMYYAVTGRNARQILINDGKQISRQQALQLYTADNGWFLREEDRLGSIESGKLADVAVLSQDYFAVRDEDLKKTRSIMTIVGGAIVHDAGA
jgi:predicted amidohydrolase YtcJ